MHKSHNRDGKGGWLLTAFGCGLMPKDLREFQFVSQRSSHVGSRPDFS